jgi:hypothetical protein
MYEYQTINTKEISKTVKDTLNDEAKKGWRLVCIRRDTTLILERKKK